MAVKTEWEEQRSRLIVEKGDGARKRGRLPEQAARAMQAVWGLCTNNSGYLKRFQIA
ncbi:hypothetical protein HMPREF9371_1462 [Neisseria shayeganii 871]|uniref:Uncharacterized protein n=1 Tax=Neisseria shayeganii 871 TaxID=1032488 RepID=G4CIM3_9NEIS|nr:hypothetical protein HMPREF9371_1462 [Neisseria shayeganii 871]